MQPSKFLVLIILAGTLSLGSCAKLQSRDQMNQGVQAFKSNHYADAVRHFKEAVRLDPTNQNAQLYLATSYMIQWVPGADTPDNKKNYEMAQREFNRVLQSDPKNSLALAYLANMAYNSAQTGTVEQKNASWEEAKRWNERRVEVDPRDAEAYYYLGVINYWEAFTPIGTAKVNAKMKPTDPGPLPNAKDRAALKEQQGKRIEEGLNNLQKCLAVDKENEDAMSYMNLLLREKAMLEDTPEAAKADVAQAEDWSNRSLDMKKTKASRPAKKTEAS